MVRKYQLTNQAQADVDEILEFILEKKQNQHGARVVLDYLHAAMQDVGKNPKLGQYRTDLTNRPLKFYKKDKSHKYYILFDPATRPVHIIRIASIHRDFIQLLESD